MAQAVRADSIELFSSGDQLAIGWGKDLYAFEGAVVREFQINQSIDSFPEVNLSLITGAVRTAVDQRDHLKKIAGQLTITELFQVINDKMEERT